MKIYIDGQLTHKIHVKEGILLHDHENSPYITMNHGKIVVSQRDIRLNIDSIEYYFPGLATIESGLICISTTL